MSLLSPYLCFCVSPFLCVFTCLHVDTQPKKIRKPPGLPSSVRASFCLPSQLTASPFHFRSPSQNTDSLTHFEKLLDTAIPSLLEQFCDRQGWRPSALSDSLWADSPATRASINIIPMVVSRLNSSGFKWCSRSGCHVDKQIYSIFRYFVKSDV